MTTDAPAYGVVDRDYGRRLATTDPADDGPVWMVNLMKYHEVASYPDGHTDAGEPTSGRAADDRYAPLDVLADIGAEVVFFGDVEDQLLGDETVWDRVAVVRYPTRRAFIDMQARDDYKAKHVHKEAGLDRTFVIGCQPFDLPADLPDKAGAPSWDDVPHPPTPEDGPVMVVHVIKYAEAASRDEMHHYEMAAARSAVPAGVQIGGWFEAEGTIVGDGRTWDQVRFNRFPSKAAFMEVVLDPKRLEAQRAHRAPAMADTYTMIVRPRIDHLDH